MAYKKRYFYWLLLSCVVLTAFSGCATEIPFTKSVIREVGEERTSEFQYYLSKKITLKLNTEKSASTVKDGQLVRRSQTVREQITIPGNSLGLVRHFEKMINGDEYLLKVAFENTNDDSVIEFAQNYERDKEYYYILYNNTEKRIIKYGNDEYIVNFEGSDHPYLLIKMKEYNKETSKNRRIQGLKLSKNK